MKNSQGHDVAFLHCKQHQHLHSTNAPLLFFFKPLSFSFHSMQTKEQALQGPNNTHWVKITYTDMQNKADKGPTLMEKGLFRTHITHGMFA